MDYHGRVCTCIHMSAHVLLIMPPPPPPPHTHTHTHTHLPTTLHNFKVSHHVAVLQGDRAGICVTQLDPDLLERGLACAPGSLPSFSSAVAAVEKVRFFAGAINSKVRFLSWLPLVSRWQDPPLLCECV